ncbi:His-Xaa-Ser system radical SAM maturase HxsB [Candidatus Woesearchaeota archaeon]|nr:His-Xaa-Ser system radical SAM maturase HxsB [Candidatus Woesearchaeota archaeon]
MMKYNLNNYRDKKIRNKYLITTDHGSWIFLTENEYEQLKSGKFSKKLFVKLEKTGIIITDKNLNQVISDYRKRNSSLLYGTSLHIVVPTLRCNMNCIYCHASSVAKNKKEYDMDKKTAKKVVDFIFQSTNNSVTIEFQGGEPLLNWDVVKYITNYALEKNEKEKKNLQLTIVTNLIEMDEKKLQFLMKKGVTICTSLDGPKEVHDYNRRYVSRSSYDFAVKWIKKINKEYKKRGKDRKISALVTLTKKSLKYPKEIVDEYVNLGLETIHLRFLNGLGVAQKSWKNISYSVKDYLRFWEKAVDYIERLRKKGVKIEERMVKIIEQKIKGKRDPGYLDLRSPCGAAIGQLVYNYNGKIYSCDEARMLKEDLFMLGDVKKDNYKNILTSDKTCSVINASINENFICNNCVYKPYCGVCPVCNYAEQGNIIADIGKTARCQIFMNQFEWVFKKNL